MGIEMLITVPLIVALTEVVKRAVPDLPVRFYPLVAIAFAVAGAVTFTLIPDASFIVEAIITGLTAAGLYSGTKAVVDG